MKMHLVVSFLAQCAKTACGIYVDAVYVEADPRRITCKRCRGSHDAMRLR